MKRTNLLISAIALIILSLTFHSCNKKETVLKQKSKFHSNRFADFGNPPIVSDGILEFTDQSHYNDWLEYIDLSCKGDTTGEDTTTTEEIFDEIETNISFISLRKSLRDQFNILDQTGWANLDGVPEMHFIGDQTVLSTLNSYGEVKIGSDVINYLDKDHIVIIKNPIYISAVRSFKTSGYTFASEIFELPGVIQGEDITIEYNNALPFDMFARVTENVPTGGELGQIDGSIIPDPCDGHTVTLKGFGLREGSNLGVQSSFSIGWGDGSWSSSNAGVYLRKVHTYSSVGTYTVTIIATPAPGSGYTGTYTWSVPITISASCRKDSRNSNYVWKYTPDGMRATRDYVSVTMQKGGLKRIYASTEAYSWQGNSWKTKKADRLRTEACMEVLNHGNCSAWYNHCDPTEHKTDRFVQAGFNVSQIFGWNVAYSNHKILHDNNWYTHYLPLSVCP